MGEDDAVLTDDGLPRPVLLVQHGRHEPAPGSAHIDNPAPRYASPGGTTALQTICAAQTLLSVVISVMLAPPPACAIAKDAKRPTYGAYSILQHV